MAANLRSLVNGGRGLGTSGPTLNLSRTEFFSSSSPGSALLIERKIEDLKFDSCTVFVLDPAILSKFPFFPS